MRPAHLPYFVQMSRRGVATLRCCEGGHHDEASEPLSADLKFTVPTEYVGPVGERAQMEAGCVVDNLGLQILIGPSRVSTGRGLFVSVAQEEGVDKVVLHEGTLISGYSKTGSWVNSWQGDKSVAFAFDSPDTAVVYDKELMPLIEAVSVAEGVSENITGGLVGHVIYFDDENDELAVAPDAQWQGARYFVPDEDPQEWGPANFGICANDLAYSPGISESAYALASADKNVLQLVWRMEVNETEEALTPSWPVVFLQRSIAFTNTEPMEVGISYGYRYWKSKESQK